MYRISSKWIEDLKCKTRNIKLLEEHFGGIHFGIFGGIFFFFFGSSQERATKTKKQMRSHQTKKICTSKGNHK